MTTLHATLLGFALWTVAVLTFTVGAHRWSQILTGRAAINQFPAHAPAGPDWYRRGTRAHLNCVENLPVFTAIVFVAWVADVHTTTLDLLGVAVLGARLVQTITHVAFAETARTVSIRFTFFSVQLVAMLVMVGVVIASA